MAAYLLLRPTAVRTTQATPAPRLAAGPGTVGTALTGP